MSGGVAVASLDAIDADNRKVIMEPTQAFKSGEEPPLTVPSFMYISNAMAQALLGAAPSSLKRGAPGKMLHGEIKWDETPAPGRNVVAHLPGSDPKLKGEYVAIGAHNDHIGFSTACPSITIRCARSTRSCGRKGEDDDERRRRRARRRQIRAILDSLRKPNTPRARLDLQRRR